MIRSLSLSTCAASPLHVARSVAAGSDGNVGSDERTPRGMPRAWIEIPLSLGMGTAGQGGSSLGGLSRTVREPGSARRFPLSVWMRAALYDSIHTGALRADRIPVGQVELRVEVRGRYSNRSGTRGHLDPLAQVFTREMALLNDVRRLLTDISR